MKISRNRKTVGDSSYPASERRGREEALRNSTVLRDTAKRYLVLLLATGAITSSVLAIYSCKFFSYKEIEVTDDNHNILLVESSSDDKIPEVDIVSYEPFEYLSEAGVGLFSYYMGDPSGKGVMMDDPMCFYYCDEYTDYQWLSSNNKKTGTGNVDVWLVARYCSILAPIVGLLAFLRLLLPQYWCGCRWGRLLATLLFWLAAFLEFGTFAVMFAPPSMYSSSSEEQQQQFCFSTTSTVQCYIDTGAMFSVGSAVAFLVLAVVSSGCMLSSGSTGTNVRGTTHIGVHHKSRTTTKNGNDNNDGKHSEDDTSDSSVSCESC
mmetsp:Transcript_21837/g.48990  ORF Transcript_21837/g.48990 Transcript_21837/m.48990 type:complete len:320 (-) Transcript_21837:402-1361(-)|eukprot:CAMPEP_0201126192 /NCGR_PEP_ID=MMETSP0850-20130426/25078_1 /ASSEMBLY_ACC=CAM_ASM_000622 /TAXON_ID=183588 /ORGANISM="Pseudo-nitzschia fraudulenta, Strain WWA7" /LENGTH=319 /DNA_ID=CAMNT_0047394533 /DNA_START=147 /DNA_END=1106 /DNA_ORIENTATION=-